jgi:hypothetical protein
MHLKNSRNHESLTQRREDAKVFNGLHKIILLCELCPASSLSAAMARHAALLANKY